MNAKNTGNDNRRDSMTIEFTVQTHYSGENEKIIGRQ